MVSGNIRKNRGVVVFKLQGQIVLSGWNLKTEMGSGGVSKQQKLVGATVERC